LQWTDATWPQSRNECARLCRTTPGPEIMSRQLESYGINILKLHAAWLLANGYKREASSCKQQIRMILINKKKKEKQQAASFKLDSLSLR